jgi:ribosomal protein RSM22 (predicted rRNA methylase)
MSEGFTKDEAASTPSARDDVAYAYLAYFAPRTSAALAAVLIDATAPDRAVDLGSGTGAAALVLALAGTSELRLVDRDPLALELARRLLSRLTRPPRVSTLAADLRQVGALAQDGATLVSAFTLGELWPDEGEGALAWLEALAAGAPRALLLDAGDRRRARGLQGLREQALAAGWHLRGPCPHADRCPAFERRRDWCHVLAPRLLSPRLERFALFVGRDPAHVAFTWLDLVRDAPPRPQEGVLVIGEPRKEKGRVRLPVCGPEGLRFLQALRRDREAYEDLLAAERGERLAPKDAEQRGNTAHLAEPPERAP